MAIYILFLILEEKILIFCLIYYNVHKGLATKYLFMAFLYILHHKGVLNFVEIFFWINWDDHEISVSTLFMWWITHIDLPVLKPSCTLQSSELCHGVWTSWCVAWTRISRICWEFLYTRSLRRALVFTLELQYLCGHGCGANLLVKSINGISVHI